MRITDPGHRVNEPTTPPQTDHRPNRILSQTGSLVSRLPLCLRPNRRRGLPTQDNGWRHALRLWPYESVLFES